MRLVRFTWRMIHLAAFGFAALGFALLGYLLSGVLVSDHYGKLDPTAKAEAKAIASQTPLCRIPFTKIKKFERVGYANWDITCGIGIFRLSGESTGASCVENELQVGGFTDIWYFDGCPATTNGLLSPLIPYQ